MKKTTFVLGLVSGLLALTLSASGSERTIPPPPPSAFADAESSGTASFPTDEGRRVKLTLSADFTPSNGVQVALGQDSNADGDLEPGETRVVFGVDGGEPFVREEFGQWRSEMKQCSPSIFTFAFRQPSAVTNRLTHAKVTTRGRGNSAAQIAAEITRPGAALILQ